MFPVIIFTYLVLSVKGNSLNNETSQKIVVRLMAIGDNCQVAPNYKFKQGSTVILETDNKMMNGIIPYYINKKNLTINNKTLDEWPGSIKLTNRHNGVWKIDYFYLKDVTLNNGWEYAPCGKDNKCVHSTCKTNVKVVTSDKEITPVKEKLPLCLRMNGISISLLILVVLAVAFIIIGQTCTILHYRRKVQQLNVHNNLTKQKEDTQSLDARYFTKPRKNIELAVQESRDSGIYAVPDVDVSAACRPPFPLPKQESDDDEPMYEEAPPAQDPQTIRKPIHQLLGQKLPGFGPRTQPVNLKPTTSPRRPVQQPKPSTPRTELKRTRTPLGKPEPLPTSPSSKAIQKPVRVLPAPITQPKPGRSHVPPIPTPVNATKSADVQNHEQFFKEYREKHSSDYWDDDWYDGPLYGNDIVMKSNALSSEKNKK